MSVPHETVGYTLPAWETTVDRARQTAYHGAAGIEPGLYGEAIDASVLANDCLHGARPRDALGAKRLHVGVRVRQTAPVPLGTHLQVRAAVETLEPVPRGRMIGIGFAFETEPGTAPIRIEHQSLILDGASPKNATAKPASPEEDFETIRRLQLTPEMVSGYSFEFPHLEGHHDPEAAKRIGMRAPIAQGLMGFTLLLAERWRLGPAEAIDVTARFLRPIFWDDALTLQVDAAGKRLRALNSEGKAASAVEIHDWRT